MSSIAIVVFDGHHFYDDLVGVDESEHWWWVMERWSCHWYLLLRRSGHHHHPPNIYSVPTMPHGRQYRDGGANDGGTESSSRDDHHIPISGPYYHHRRRPHHRRRHYSQYVYHSASLVGVDTSATTMWLNDSIGRPYTGPPVDLIVHDENPVIPTKIHTPPVVVRSIQNHTCHRCRR